MKDGVSHGIRSTTAVRLGAMKRPTVLDDKLCSRTTGKHPSNSHGTVQCGIAKKAGKKRVETTRVGESGNDVRTCKTIIIKLVKLISIKGS